MVALGGLRWCVFFFVELKGAKIVFFLFFDGRCRMASDMKNMKNVNMIPAGAPYIQNRLSAEQMFFRPKPPNPNHDDRWASPQPTNQTESSAVPVERKRGPDSWFPGSP